MSTSDSRIDQILLAVAGSLAAAAVYSLITMASEYADHRQQEAETVGAIETHVAPLRADLQLLGQRLSQVESGGRSAMRNLTRLTNTNQRAEFVLAKHPRDLVTKCIDDARKVGDLQIDAIGINLGSLYNDHLKHIVGLHTAKVRIILPNPESTSFANMCAREGRDRKVTADRIDALTKTLVFGDDAGRVAVRWSNDPSTITLVRVNNTIVWRPRFFNDDKSSEHFYCVFDRALHEKMFKMTEEEYDELWSESTAVRSDKFL